MRYILTSSIQDSKIGKMIVMEGAVYKTDIAGRIHTVARGVQTFIGYCYH